MFPVTSKLPEKVEVEFCPLTLIKPAKVEVAVDPPTLIKDWKVEEEVTLIPPEKSPLSVTKIERLTTNPCKEEEAVVEVAMN